MNISADLIDQIVRDVMRELNSRSASPMVRAASVQAAATFPPSNQSTNKLGTEPIAITHKVVSEDVLAGLGVAGKVITLPATAVLTPSGRDFIRRNQVRLTSITSGNTSAASNTGLMIAIGDNSSGQTAADTIGWSVQAAESEIAAAEIAMKVALNRKVVCCGGEPSIVCCVLNRQPELRAAVVTRNTNLTALGRSMNPHVVCLESTGWSIVDILRLLRSLNPGRQTPENWKELDVASPGGPQ